MSKLRRRLENPALAKKTASKIYLLAVMIGVKAGVYSIAAV